MAGYVAENLLTGKVAFAAWDAPDQEDGAVALDVREDAERLAFGLPGAEYTDRCNCSPALPSDR